VALDLLHLLLDRQSLAQVAAAAADGLLMRQEQVELAAVELELVMRAVLTLLLEP
jgi:hypothetical protein